MKQIRISKSAHIYKILKAEIFSGKYKPDELFYSETEVMQRFEVSRPTAIRVLKDLQQDKLLVRRIGSGTYVSSPPQEKNAPWGVMMSTGESGHSLHPMISQLLIATRKINKTLIIGDHKWSELESLSKEDQLSILFRPFLQGEIEGLFFVPFYDSPRQSEHNRYEDLLNPFNQLFLDHLQSLTIPVVLLDYGMKSFPCPSDHDLIATDHFQGGYLQGQHLLQNSAGSIHFLCSESHEFIPSIQARREGLQFALREKGLSLKIEKLDPHNIDQINFFLKKEKPNYLIASNDDYAAKIINTLYHLQISIPDQIKVIGFDNSPAAENSVIPITTVQQPFAEIAEVSTKILSDRIAGGTFPRVTILLKPQMIVRRSSP